MPSTVSRCVERASGFPDGASIRSARSIAAYPTCSNASIAASGPSVSAAQLSSASASPRSRVAAAALPEDTLVTPGHHAETVDPADDGTYTARLGELRERLPALKLDRETFVERIRGDIPPRPANFERIVAINLGTDSADDDTAFELELGPNNCAAAPL